MNNHFSDPVFWWLLGAGALVVSVQSGAVYGWLAAPMGIGPGASLGAVVYYLGAMIVTASRWLLGRWNRQQPKRQ